MKVSTQKSHVTSRLRGSHSRWILDFGQYASSLDGGIGVEANKGVLTALLICSIEFSKNC